nr:MAG TPA: hypothetical protein [Caudoviricetes sp.]
MHLRHILSKNSKSNKRKFSKAESFNMIIWFAELSTRLTLSAVMFGRHSKSQTTTTLIQE